MKTQGKITMCIRREGTLIQIEDKESSTMFCEIKLTPQQLNNILSGIAFVDCELETNGLEKIGKRHECDTFEFEIEEDDMSDKNSEILSKKANNLLSDGWVADRYFGSQNSFFKKDGRFYARCTIRRWV